MARSSAARYPIVNSAASAGWGVSPSDAERSSSIISAKYKHSHCTLGSVCRAFAIATSSGPAAYEAVNTSPRWHNALQGLNHGSSR